MIKRFWIIAIIGMIFIGLLSACSSMDRKYIRTMKVTDTIVSIDKEYDGSRLYLMKTQLWGDKEAGYVMAEENQKLTIGETYNMVIDVRSGVLYGEFYYLVSYQKVE